MSEKFSLTKVDKRKWFANQIDFLKPLAAYIAFLYFTPILVALGGSDHIVSWSDFIPSSQVVTAVVFYLVNAAYDIIRKWAGETK
jgi:hypothetical protein